jgi:hypothetical protein
LLKKRLVDKDLTVPFLVLISFFISLFMLLLDMDKKVDLREFISTLQNRTHENAVAFKDEGVPIAVLMAYEDYLELIKNVGEE